MAMLCTLLVLVCTPVCASGLAARDQPGPPPEDQAREIELRQQHVDAWRGYQIACGPVRVEFLLELAQSPHMIEAFTPPARDHARPAGRPMPGAGRRQERGHTQVQDL